MGGRIVSALYVLALIVTIIAVDVMFLRYQFWERLAVNVGIVLVFTYVYFRFIKGS